MKKTQPDLFHGIRLIAVVLGLFAFAVGCQQQTTDDKTLESQMPMDDQTQMDDKQSEAKPAPLQDEEEDQDGPSSVMDDADDEVKASSGYPYDTRGGGK